MAIKGKELQEFRPAIRYMDGAGITLQSVADAIASRAANYDIPVSFRNDQISNGLFSNNVPCIVLYHPQHSNTYYNFCIQCSHQGKIALVNIHLCGTSKQISKENMAHNKTGAGWAMMFGGAVGIGYGITALATKAIGSLGRNKSALQEEQNWYGAIQGIIDEIIS